MNTFMIVGLLIAVAYAQIRPEENVYTGPTPPQINCPNELCAGKSDGNYEHPSEQHHYMQCIGGMAYCQACWPNDLFFSGKCNQCMYNLNDECYTTATWAPASTFACPDMCGNYGPDHTGNVDDPSNQYHYVACWYGVTVGCVACPAGLMFNMEENACLYEGKYFTQPDQSQL